MRFVRTTIELSRSARCFFILGPGQGLVAMVLLVILAAAKPASGIDVEQECWGFDGQVVLDRFNLLSVLVSNPTDRPVEAAIELQKRGAGTDKVGAAIVESVYLSPFASRWVQFFPYVTGQFDEWTLSWGRRSDQRYEVAEPRVGGAAQVVLVEADDLTRSRFSIKAFPEDLFPPLVAATGNLRSILLDHAPRWQKPRRDAFLDWIHGGGRVGLLPGEDGEYPTFGGSLAVLNTPLSSQHLGAGTVVRLGDSDTDETSRFLQETKRSADEDPDAAAGTSDAQYDYQFGQNVFSALRQLTDPQHNWPVIHAISLTYLAIIFPGWYFCSRRKVDYRITLLGFLCVAIAFGAAFQAVGRRGYGETTCVNSVAIARPLQEGAYDVMQWTNVFVTNGDTYQLSHGDGGHLYSTCQQVEKVNGVIDNGLNGSFVVDMPLFSSREFAHRGKITRAPFRLELIDFELEADQIKSLVLKTDESFPEEWLSIKVLHRHQMRDLRPQDDELRITGAMNPIGSYLDMEGQSTRDYYPRGRWYQEESKVDRHKVYRDLLPSLIARALKVYDQDDATKFSLDDDRCRVFVYARSDAAFQLATDELQNQDGYVLYVVDLFIPENP